jgi:dTDP-4-dehydrorhamnose 3,5-epimerase-like enzyme
MQKTNLSYIIELPKIQDEGFLCFAESEKHIAFPIKRLYYIFDVDDGAIRGKHTHKETQQILFCLRGSIKIILDNGKEKEEIILDEPHKGLFLDKMMWHEMVDFQKDTLLLVVASDFYAESDYIRNYEDFVSLRKKL